MATKEHTEPSRDAWGPTRAALVVAFPEPGVLPVPKSGGPVGRDWFEQHGVVDERVSSRHAVFTRPGGGLHVEDAGSRNGVWVNGSRLRSTERVPLADGAVIRVGRTLMVYREAFPGDDDRPSPPLGKLVGPYGLRDVVDDVKAIAARRPRNVLIVGETGTGKELVARVLAERARPRGKYGVINVAGIASGVFESQLFGYVPGAYSGSGRGSPGFFVEHDGGAVFLDEIGELAADLQAKLLRVLDNREVLAVGANRAKPVDLLVISATNRPLEEMVSKGTFRQDLVARLEAARIDLPPLRDRAEDLYEIMRTIVEARGERLLAERVEVEAVERLMLEPWPSNVRGVQAALERIARITPPPELTRAAVERVLGPRVPVPPGPASALTLDLVQDAIRTAGGVAQAAKRLGVSRGRLLRFLKSHQ